MIWNPSYKFRGCGEETLLWVLKGCLVETQNYSILSLAFIASSFGVTEDNLLFETVQSGPYSLSNVFSDL